jgi:predicted nucleic acid-binding protein
MNVDAALMGVTRIFLDSAPVIYLVERNPARLALMLEIFRRIAAGMPEAFTSPVTLAECLIAPLRLEQVQLQQDFTDLILEGENTTFIKIDGMLARRAAEVRAQYNLSLPDAIQVAVALQAGCEAILTNDIHLRRVAELRVVLVDELEL